MPIIDLLLSQYGGDMDTARKWMREPLLAVIRLAGQIKRRHTGKDEAATPEVAGPPKMELVQQLEDMHQQLQEMKKEE